jgi:hypothetical protein
MDNHPVRQFLRARPGKHLTYALAILGIAGAIFLTHQKINKQKIYIQSRLEESCQAIPKPAKIDYDRVLFHFAIMWPNHIWNANLSIDQLALTDSANRYPPLHTLKNRNLSFRFWSAIYNRDYTQSLIILDSLELDAALGHIKKIQYLKQFPQIDDLTISEARDYAIINAMRIPLWLALGKFDAIRRYAIQGRNTYSSYLPAPLIAQAIRELSPMPLSQRRKELIQALIDIKSSRKHALSPVLYALGKDASVSYPSDTTEYAVNFHGFLFYGGSAPPETTYYRDPWNRNSDSITEIKNTMEEALETILGNRVISDLYCRDPTLSERCADTTYPVNLRECAAAPATAKGSATPPGCINPDGSVKSWWSDCGIEWTE